MTWVKNTRGNNSKQGYSPQGEERDEWQLENEPLASRGDGSMGGVVLCKLARRLR